MLQSSSSSSSEKDMGLGNQKKKLNKPMNLGLRVPEESAMEENQDHDKNVRSR